MKTRAAVAWKVNEPLSIEDVDLEGPRAGEVLVETLVRYSERGQAYVEDLKTTQQQALAVAATQRRASCWADVPVRGDTLTERM